jgi:hypothetical protein
MEFDNKSAGMSFREDEEAAQCEKTFADIFAGEVIDEKENRTCTASIKDRLGDLTHFVASNNDLAMDGKTHGTPLVIPSIYNLCFPQERQKR